MWLYDSQGAKCEVEKCYVYKNYGGFVSFHTFFLHLVKGGNNHSTNHQKIVYFSFLKMLSLRIP